MLKTTKMRKGPIAIMLVGALTVVGATQIGLNNAEKDSIASLAQINEQQAATASYILQGTNTDRIIDAVQNVGGSVSDVFPIINAVSALLTPNQADQLSTLHKLRVKNDRSVELSSIPDHLKTQSAEGIIDNFIAKQTLADKVHDAGITGKGVGVAIIDSGLNLGAEYQDLKYDRLSGETRVTKFNAYTKSEYTHDGGDWNGHGTHLAGIIADSAQNEQNLAFNGIAPDVNLISVRAFKSNGISTYRHLLSGLDWVYNVREKYNIRVLNLSFGVNPVGMYYDDPINQAVMKLWDAGIVVVVSAGNKGQKFGITVPGNNPYVLTVGAATDNVTPYELSDDRVVSFSSQGPTYEGFIKPDVVTYGGQIAARLKDWERSFIEFNQPDYANNYVQMSGTSQAAAITSGVAALVIANNPTLSPDDVKCKIMSSSKLLARNDEGTLYTPLEQGSGMIDAWGAVMSDSVDCANQGLNIKTDLAGTEHFRGPVFTDTEGNLVLRDEYGDFAIDNFKNPNNVVAQRNWWGNDSLELMRNWWGNDSLELMQTESEYDELSLKRNWWGNDSLELMRNWWGNDSLELMRNWWGNDSLELDSVWWEKDTNNAELESASYKDE